MIEQSLREVPWSKSIRKNIYELLVLLLVFALVATVYRVWFHSQLIRMKEYSNNYHLNNQSKYLKASKYLRKVEGLLNANEWIAPSSKSQKTKMKLDNFEIEQSLHLAKQLIWESLEVEKAVDDKGFEKLTSSLALKFERFNLVFNQFVHSQDQLTGGLLNIEINKINIALHQISKLHELSYRVLFKVIHQFDSFHTRLFYSLSFLLLLLSLFVVNRFMVTVDKISIKQKETEDIIQHQAHYDSLTKLPNRYLSLERLKQVIESAKRAQSKAAVLFVDLDDFKKINDTLGHSVGDLLLVEAANRLRSIQRSSDTVGRLGGDEFVVILENISELSDACHIAEALIRKMRKPFKINQREFLISASIGISGYPMDGLTAGELLQHADSAMYHAKDSGRSTYSFFTDAMNKNIRRRLEIEEQLHDALARGEMKVVLQPLIELEKQKIVGAEALLRWNNVELGEVGPDEFIPIAEHSGFIVPLGQFVLTEVLHSLVELKRFEGEFRMAINLSPRQFRDPGLVKMLAQATAEAEIFPNQMELEITEGILMSGHTYIKNALYEINRLGFNLVMDDFGTGYSSLSYIRNFPFDTIKVDRSFVKDLASSQSSCELVNAAINMAHSLQKKVVAEGVETLEQLNLLISMNCDYVQGFYFGKPVPFPQFKELLELQYSSYPFNNTNIM